MNSNEQATARDESPLQNLEDVDAILDAVSEPEEYRVLKTPEERAIAARIIPILAGKANAVAEANKAKELNKVVEELKTQNSTMIERELSKIRDAAKPPDLKQIEQLLNQAYIEVPYQLRGANGTRDRAFVIRELPQEAETRFVQIIRKSLVPWLKEFAAVEWTNTSTVAERIQRVLEIFPEALEVMAELVAVSLDPFKEDSEITPAWVARHIGSYRMSLIIQAQIEAGRLRDFFLQISHAIPQTMS